QLYSAAEQEFASAAHAKTSVALSAKASSGQWLQVETGDEGIYRITAQDLVNAGISGTIDPNEIELFGIGGDILPEKVTAQSGEWTECPIELHAASGQFQDLLFYATGTTVWKYSGELALNVDGLYHTMN